MTEAQIAHQARNAARKAEAQARKVDRFLKHLADNNRRAEDAAALRATRRELNAEIHAWTNGVVASKAAEDRTIRVVKHETSNRELHETAVAARSLPLAA